MSWIPEAMGQKGYTYEPKWTKDVDLNPDHCPSGSALFINAGQDATYWTLHARNYGAIVLTEVGGVPRGLAIHEDAILR